MKLLFRSPPGFRREDAPSVSLLLPEAGGAARSRYRIGLLAD